MDVDPPITTEGSISNRPGDKRSLSPLRDVDSQDDPLPFTFGTTEKSSRSLRRSSRAVVKTYADDEETDEEFLETDDENLDLKEDSGEEVMSFGKRKRRDTQVKSKAKATSNSHARKGTKSTSAPKSRTTGSKADRHRLKVSNLTAICIAYLLVKRKQTRVP